MTTFAQMRTAVFGITRRPELAALTDTAIRLATQRAHQIDFFPRDLARSVLVYNVVPTKMFYDFPNISVTLPGLRSLKNGYGLTIEGFQIEQLEYRSTDDLYDSDGRPRRYVYTLVGDTLRCYFDMPTGQLEVYYFKMPVVTEAGYASWIADNHPDELAQWAAAIVFARSGFMEIAQKIEREEISLFKEMLLSNYLLATVN
jgi:hypothetical protein